MFKAQMYEADKMFLMIEKDLRSCVALNVHPDQVNQEQFEDIKFKFMSPLDRKYLNVIPINNSNNFFENRYCVVMRKQSISLLNLENDSVFKLIIRPQAHELDFFEHCYVTGEIP